MDSVSASTVSASTASASTVSANTVSANTVEQNCVTHDARGLCHMTRGAVPQHSCLTEFPRDIVPPALGPAGTNTRKLHRNLHRLTMRIGPTLQGHPARFTPSAPLIPSACSPGACIPSRKAGELAPRAVVWRRTSVVQRAEPSRFHPLSGRLFSGGLVSTGQCIPPLLRPGLQPEAAKRHR